MGLCDVHAIVQRICVGEVKRAPNSSLRFEWVLYNHKNLEVSMQPSAKTVPAYLKEIPPERKPALKKLRATVDSTGEVC